MNVYQAMMAAADHIETYPTQYNFMQGFVDPNRADPKYGDGGQGCCVLARIGRVMNAANKTSLTQCDDTANAIGFASAQDFYLEMTVAQVEGDRVRLTPSWTVNAENAAKYLRMLAKDRPEAEKMTPATQAIQEKLEAMECV